MPEYKLMPDGSIVFTSLEDVLEAQRQQSARRSKSHEAHEGAARSGSAKQPPPEPEEPAQEEAPRPANGEAWARFVSLLKEHQRATLRVIKMRDNITLTELVTAIGAAQTSSVAGYLTGIVRNAEKAGIKLADVFRRTEQGYGPKRVVRYKAGALLRSHDVPE